MKSWKKWLFSALPAVSMLATSLAPAHQVATQVDIVDRRAGDFTLNSPDGPLSLSDLRGKVVLMFFGYTSCADVCPLSLAKIDAGFSNLDAAALERVRGLFITLDPARDTTEVLEKYTGYFHPNIIGLTESEEAIAGVANQYGVDYQREELPNSALGYSISHPLDILVVDPTGKLVDAIPHDTDADSLRRRILGILDSSDQ